MHCPGGKGDQTVIDRLEIDIAVRFGVAALPCRSKTVEAQLPAGKTLGLAVEVINSAQGTVFAYRRSQRNAVFSQRNVEVGNVVRPIAMCREFQLERGGCRPAISGNLRDPVQRFGEVGLQDLLDVAQLARGQGNSLLRIDPYLVAALSAGYGCGLKRRGVV